MIATDLETALTCRPHLLGQRAGLLREPIGLPYLTRAANRFVAFCTAGNRSRDERTERLMVAVS